MASGSLSPESPFYQAPHVTDHAADRWDERTSPTSVSPETAWQESTVLPPLAHDAHDELRIHEPQAVVLARRDSAVTTVLATVGPDAEHWLHSHVYSAVGPVWMDAPTEYQEGVQ